MRVSLQPITGDNWQQVIRLKLREGQENFVAPNWYSMLQAYFEGFTARAVYAGEVMVGFAMYGEDKVEMPGQCWIMRLMTDADHQGKGYGRAAMHLIIAELKALPECDAIYISFEPENHTARALYESLGFQDTGHVDDGELVFKLPVTV